MKIITKTSELEDFCQKLSLSDFITVDTEFHREKTYWPLLCLIQVAGNDDAACIDALSEKINLEPLYSLFKNKKITKVFHAARQDLEIFFHLAKLIPSPIFDTQIAAMVCGFGESVSYQNIVAKLTNSHIDKSLRFTDWTSRPLTKKQLNYALDDVIYLREVYVKIKEDLANQERTNWVKEELANLTDPKTYELEPNDAWKRIKSRNKKPRFLAVLKELASWREKEAQSQNIPRRRIISDESLIELASLMPTTKEQISKTRLSRHYSRSKYNIGIINSINKGIKIPGNELPTILPAPKRSPRNGPVVELLKVLLKTKCEEHNVATKLVATVDDLENIASDYKENINALIGWRYKLFGEDAIKLKKGEIAITFSIDKQKIVIIPTK